MAPWLERSNLLTHSHGPTRITSLDAGTVLCFHIEVIRCLSHVMSNVTLNLVVLRSTDMARAAEFYSRLGLQFRQHRHGSGPEHFAAELPGWRCVRALSAIPTA